MVAAVAVVVVMVVVVVALVRGRGILLDDLLLTEPRLLRLMKRRDGGTNGWMEGQRDRDSLIEKLGLI